MLDENEKKVISKVVKEMKDAHTIVGFWLKGSPVDVALSSWIASLEPLLKEEVRK